jgi:hypothetical protein
MKKYYSLIKAGKKVTFFALFLLAVAFQSKAATKTSVTNGDWSNPTTWSPAGVPAMGDDIIINSIVSNFPTTSFGKSSKGSAVFTLITVNPGQSLTGTAATLTMNYGKIINNGTISVGEIILNNASEIVNTGSITTVGDLTLNQDTKLTSTGTMLIKGSINTAKNSEIFLSNPTSTLTVIGDLNLNDATLTNGIGSVLTVGGNYAANMKSVYNNNGTTLFKGNFMNNGVYTGSGGGTSIIRGISTNNGTIGGTQDFCDSSAYSGGSGNIVDFGTQPTSPNVTHCAIAPLPVVLISFNAIPTSNGVVLKWATASELNNNFFEVLRSTNGVDYTVIGNVEGHGTTNALHRYTYTDKTPVSGIVYYQLRQVDFNGTSEKSPVVSVKGTINAATTISLYPNPVGNSVLNVQFSQEYNSVAHINIMSASGHMVYTSNTESHPGVNTIQVDTRSLKPGLYILIFNDGKSQTSTRFSK